MSHSACYVLKWEKRKANNIKHDVTSSWHVLPHSHEGNDRWGPREWKKWENETVAQISLRIAEREMCYLFVHQWVCVYLSGALFGPKEWQSDNYLKKNNNFHGFLVFVLYLCLFCQRLTEALYSFYALWLVRSVFCIKPSVKHPIPLLWSPC